MQGIRTPEQAAIDIYFLMFCSRVTREGGKQAEKSPRRDGCEGKCPSRAINLSTSGIREKACHVLSYEGTR